MPCMRGVALCRILDDRSASDPCATDPFAAARAAADAAFAAGASRQRTRSASCRFLRGDRGRGQRERWCQNLRRIPPAAACRVAVSGDRPPIAHARASGAPSLPAVAVAGAGLRRRLLLRVQNAGLASMAIAIESGHSEAMKKSPYLFRAADHELHDATERLKVREAVSEFGIALRYQERAPDLQGAAEADWCETGHSIFILAGRIRLPV